MASNLTPAELAAIVAGFNAYAANGPGGMALYKSPDGWTYYDARYSDEQGHIGGFIGRYETARFAAGTHVPADTFDPHDGRYLGPSSFDATSPWWTNGMLPFLMVGAAFGATLLGAGATAGATTSGALDAGGSGAFLGEGMASGVPAWDAAATSAGLTLSGTAGVAATTAASSLTSTLTQAGGAIKTALGLATAAGAAGAAGGSRPAGFVPNTTYTAATPTTAAPGDAGGITTLLALALGFLALHG